MINTAMLASRDGLNEFTQYLKEQCETTDMVIVRLRDGSTVGVMFVPEDEEQFVRAGFVSNNWTMCWNLDGSSVTSREYDIISC